MDVPCVLILFCWEYARRRSRTSPPGANSTLSRRFTSFPQFCYECEIDICQLESVDGRTLVDVSIRRNRRRGNYLVAENEFNMYNVQNKEVFVKFFDKHVPGNVPEGMMFCPRLLTRWVQVDRVADRTRGIFRYFILYAECRCLEGTMLDMNTYRFVAFPEHGHCVEIEAYFDAINELMNIKIKKFDAESPFAFPFETYEKIFSVDGESSISSAAWENFFEEHVPYIPVEGQICNPATWTRNYDFPVMRDRRLRRERS